MSLPTQLYEEVPAICLNALCKNYNSFELVDVDDILTDEDGWEYVLCDECGEEIYLEK